MQALSPEEAAELRLHLATCALCRDELAEVSGDLALVALSVEQHPVPEGARRRFIEKISASPAPTVTTQAPVVSIRAKQPVGRFTTWVPWALAACLAIFAIALGMRNLSLQQQLQQQAGLAASQAAANAHAQEVLDLLTAPSAQRVVLTAAKTHAEPTARAVYLPSRGTLILQASNLTPLPPDKTYELWVIPASGAPIPAGTFRPDATGSASLVLPPLPKGVPAKAFGVTIEKASGSDTPTAPIVLSGAAPAAGE